MTDRQPPQWPLDANTFNELRDATLGIFAVLGEFKLSRVWTLVVPPDSELLAEDFELLAKHAEVALKNLGFLAVAKQAINDHLSIATREDLSTATIKAGVKRPAVIPDSEDCCPSYARNLAGDLHKAVFLSLRDIGVELSCDAFSEADEWDALLSDFNFEDMGFRRIIGAIDEGVQTCEWLEEIDVPALHAFTIREFAALRYHLGMDNDLPHGVDQAATDPFTLHCKRMEADQRNTHRDIARRWLELHPRDERTEDQVKRASEINRARRKKAKKPEKPD